MELLSLLILLLVIGAVIFFRGLQKKSIQPTSLSPKRDRESIGANYELKNTFFTRSEKPFFDELQKQNNNRYTILSKVRMEDIVNVVSGLERKKSYGLRSRIKSRHIDFVILEKSFGKILAVIELDGHSHNWKGSQKGDNLKNEVFAAVGVKFYRVKVGEVYADKIREMLNSL